MRMDIRPSALLERARSPLGKKMFRYTMVSVISVIVAQILLFVTFGILKLWSAKTCNIVAVAISGLPSYYLNRRWAWGKTGKSHFWREVAPFWTLAFIGLVVSTWAVDFTETALRGWQSHLQVAVLINAASIGAFGVLWIGKFILFNKVMFVHHPENLPEALDGRTGIPS
jgi:putative flippase GtrA